MRIKQGRTPGPRDRGETLRPFLGGIAIGAVLLGNVWLMATALGSADEHSPDHDELSGVVGSLPPPEAETPSPTLLERPSPTRLERCAAAAGELADPLQEAKPALDQWEVHIGAMNKLVVGAITLPQANAFWNQTRLGAHRRIGLFEHAAAPVARRGVDCPSPTLVGSHASAQLRACTRQVAARVQTLDIASAAITTWRHHVHDMELLRQGQLSPDDATRMWLSMWQRGKDQVDAYRTAARATTETSGCDGTTGGQPTSGSGAHHEHHTMPMPSTTASPMQSMH